MVFSSERSDALSSGVVGSWNDRDVLVAVRLDFVVEDDDEFEEILRIDEVVVVANDDDDADMSRLVVLLMRAAELDDIYATNLN